MDHALETFRRAASRENRARRGVQRRYSPALKQQAIAYWERRRRVGDGVPTIAAALGIAEWSLHRWVRAVKPRQAFQSVQVVAPAAPRAAPSLVVRLTTAEMRVEGLDVEAAARLLALLR